MNEPEFNFRKVKPLEPLGQLHFSTPQQLDKHVLKHVIRNKFEKWSLLQGVNKDDIASINIVKPDFLSPEFRRLAKRYGRMISRCALKACSEGRDHLHQVAFRINKDAQAGKTKNRVFAQYVKILGIQEKIIIILASFVQKGCPGCYIIMTAYRVYPNYDLEKWLKNAKFRLNEMSDLREKKKLKLFLLADHMIPGQHKKMI